MYLEINDPRVVIPFKVGEMEIDQDKAVSCPGGRFWPSFASTPFGVDVVV